MIKRHIPDFFTCLNLLSGCVAIVFAFEGNLVWSAYMVGICAIMDFLDGFMARALKTGSPLGKQLDSLADMVSFGVVPGVVMFGLLRETVHLENIHGCIGCIVPPEITSPSQLEKIIPFLGFIIPVFSAVRLAKFNLDTRQTDSFIGLPTPANTILIASLGLLKEIGDPMAGGSMYPTDYSILILQYWFLIPITIIFSFLLISHLKLFALKFKNFSWADNKIRYIFLCFSLCLLIIFQFIGIPLIIILYILISIINNILTKRSNELPR